MTARKSLLAAACVTAMLMPSLSFAYSDVHPSSGEVGFTQFPDHFKSTTTRAKVIADLVAARENGSLYYLQRGFPVPPERVDQTRTRKQVRDELINEPAIERRARLADLAGG